MRRVISLWLPHWQTDLHRAPSPRRDGGRAPAPPAPLALSEAAGGVARLAAVSPAAAALGLAPGMPVADARALVPALTVRPAEPARAAAALARLADWALRFTPLVSLCGADGLWLEAGGCAHLFGGEEAMLARLVEGVERQGFHARAALAETPGAAWAVARYGPGGVVAVGAVHEALVDLPAAALRLDDAAAAAVSRVGLRHVGDLARQPRAPLARRYGAAVLRRLDQAFGRAPEPLAPRRPPPPHRAHRVFAEPVADAASIAAALRFLLDELCAGLAEAGRGARRLELALFRVDGRAPALRIGTSRPVREPAALARLFAERLDSLDAGEGVEAMALAATATDPAPPRQAGFDGCTEAREALAGLVDRLTVRLGPACVARIGPRPSHQPDRATMRLPPVPPAGGGRAEAPEWPLAPRPLRLIAPPVPVEAAGGSPGGPPVLFHWRGRARRIARASGPERIEGEWWREDRPARDYYRVEDAAGARFWLYRESRHPASGARWYLHGLFG